MDEEKYSDYPAIIVQGNLSDGFNFIGPFEDFDAACDYDSAYFQGMSWIASLQPPTLETARATYNRDRDPMVFDTILPG